MATRLTSRLSLLLLAFAAVLLIFPAMALAEPLDSSGGTSPAPTIQSDKDDYTPGATVTLTGSNWQPGESVNIYVNDDEGQTWSRNVDVTADENGNIRTSSSSRLVRGYLQGNRHGRAIRCGDTTFTDGNIKVKGTFVGSTSDTFALTYTRYSGIACGGNARSGDPQTETFDTQDKTVNQQGNNSSVKMTASATSTAGRPFLNWKDSDGNLVTTGLADGRTICVDFPAGTEKTYVANYGGLREPGSGSR